MPGEMSENWSEYTLTKAILLVSHQQSYTRQGAAAGAKGGTATNEQESKLHKSHIQAIYPHLILILNKAKHDKVKGYNF